MHNQIDQVVAAFSAASPSLQRGFVENYIEVRVFLGEATEGQIDDPSFWAALAPKMIEGWAEDMKDMADTGDYTQEDVTCDLETLRSSTQ